MKSLKIKNNSGFTLIELLTVISVIAFISSIGLASFQNANLKARDAKRKHDLSQLKTAMDLYYDANNKYYELVPSGWLWSVDWGSDFKTALAPYLSPLPVDPINNGYPGYDYEYYRPALGEGVDPCVGKYMLLTHLENTSDKDWQQCSILCCGGPGGCDGFYCYAF